MHVHIYTYNYVPIYIYVYIIYSSLAFSRIYIHRDRQNSCNDNICCCCCCCCCCAAAKENGLKHACTRLLLICNRIEVVLLRLGCLFVSPTRGACTLCLACLHACMHAVGHRPWRGCMHVEYRYLEAVLLQGCTGVGAAAAAAASCCPSSSLLL